MSSLPIYLAMLMLGSSFSSTTAAKPDLPAAVQLVGEEQQFVDLINSERSSRGLGLLKIDPLLVEVSRKHSREMAEKSYFDHISPTPGQRTALDRYLSAANHNPKWALLGENLCYCSVVDVNRSHASLMKSSTHRDNILNPRFERIGVGIYKDGKGEFWVTQMFLSSVD